jgi:TolB-like protein
MLDIFLSYSRKDLATAGKVAAALQAAGHDVWWDQALKSGEVYDQVTETALREARVVVVLWSKAAVASDWVRSEATVAMQRGALMPVMIEPCQRPVMFELRQSADLTGWKGNAKDPRLVAFVADVTRQLAKSDAAAPPVVETTAAVAGPSRRALMGGAVGAAALVTGGFGAWKYWGDTGDDGTASVVVLPFANLSGDASQAYFADGLAEELRAALSQIAGLKVIGRASSERFRESADLAKVAAELGVANVLTGSVRRSSTKVRIGAQLIDSKTGVELWSQSYDRPAGDVLDIQSSIATSVLGALSPRLGRTAGKVVVGGTRNPEAQALYLQATAGDEQQIDAIRAQIAALDEAIRLDPGYALAYSARGRALSFLRGRENGIQARFDLKQQSDASFKRAFELAPQSGRTQAAYADNLMSNLQGRAGFAGAERAVRLEPGNAAAIGGASVAISRVNPVRAEGLARNAIAIDPFSARGFLGLAQALFNQRRYAESADAALKVMELSDGSRGLVERFQSLLMLRRFEDARKLTSRAPSGWNALADTALLETLAGNRAASDAALALLLKFDPERTALGPTRVYAQRGDIQAALLQLEAAWTAKSPSLRNIAFDPFLDPLRKEPRFKAVQDAIIPPDLLVPPKALRRA